MLEIQRRRLDGPPLGPQEQRSSEQMEQGEARTEAPLNEYINLRERNLQRTVLEVLHVSGIPFEESASLAKTILDIHTEQWNRNEDPATKTAIGEMKVPTTPFQGDELAIPEAFLNAPVDDEYVSTLEEDEDIRKSMKEYEEGRFYSWDVVNRSFKGEIPALQLAPQNEKSKL